MTSLSSRKYTDILFKVKCVLRTFWNFRSRQERHSHLEAALMVSTCHTTAALHQSELIDKQDFARRLRPSDW